MDIEQQTNINIDELKKRISLVRNMVGTKNNITAQINDEINSIGHNFNIPKKIIRKFFTKTTSILKDKNEEEMWIAILKDLL